MSVSLTADIQKEGESGPLIEPCGRGKTSPQPQGTKEGTGEGLELEDSTPQDVQKRAPNHSHGRKRAKSNAKLKLVRSLAVCEESSGLFSNDGPPESDIIQLHISCPSDKEEEKSSKDEYENEEKEKKDKTPRKMLSRDSSQEYTDSTGIDVHEFLVNTLKNNPRDRMMLLKLEQDILEFINDDNNQYKKFPQMTSYHRMLLHRVAAYFGMDHNVDQTGKAVIINKTGNTRIPEQRFSEHIKDERNVDFQKKFILKRDDASMDKDDNQIRVPLQDGRRSKSIEEREEEYQRVRDRIFAREVSFFLQSSQNGYINDNRGNRESSSRASSSRQSSTDSDMKCLEPRPWSSTDSDSSNRTLRPPVTKASSFSGISILTRGDSLGSNKGSQGSCKGSRSGLHLVSPDVCSPPVASQSSRSLLPCPTQQPQQPQALPQTALLPTPQQHPMGNHIIAQGEELAPQFSQMTLSRQGSSENPEPPPLYQATPTVLSQHPTPQTSYIMATTGQAMPPPSGYQPATGHPHPPPPPPPPSQTVMQAPPPQGYMQAPPPQQIQVSYYPPSQYPSSGQQYRVAQPMSHQVSYPAQRTQPMPQPAQQSGLQTMMPSQQPSYQGIMGVQQQQNPALLNTQRAGMGGQMQSIMVQYPQMPSYQVPVGNENQQVVQQQYQQQVMVPVSQSVQGPMPVYYSVITPTQPNSTSPSVGYLQPPSSEQYQITPSPSPCNPQQLQQQYSGVPPPGPGVMVMQLSVPNGPQPSQNPPLVQWNPCKYYSIEQRPGKPGDLYKPDNTPQASTQLTSPLASPTQSPTPSPSGSVNSVCPGLGPLPLIPQFPRPGGTAQGDGRYSLLGQPLQYSLCPPPLMHGQSSYSSHQGQGVMKHGARGKKQTLKSASTDLGTTDVVVSRVLEVTDLPEGISRPEAEKLFNQLSMCGAKIQWLKEPQGGRAGGCGPPGAGAEGGPVACMGAVKGDDPAHLYTVVAVFPSTMAAQSASFKLNNSAAGLFKLRATKKNYDLRVLERASSQ
ncbi:R3H domain-containing protein 2 isoform X16 [Dunckerocampus dactyliophorus]|uniref:R3H domain-containing protein 2 isoform X16 n=1 Tax=Dunckerocampus dactyliophorus TaxID=161453 RepID=UPI00240738BD|nr:R3H domain-containing protein 2 isoform X16 [Dunckerocampus dactyliophorus]